MTTELGYVPRGRQRELMDHLFSDYLVPGGRLILGPYGEERDARQLEDQIRAWGYTPAGYCEKSHLAQWVLCKRLLWFDKAP